MSVSDPFVKDIKGCVLAFLEEVKVNRQIVDKNSVLIVFCQTLEKVFGNGLVSSHNKFGFIRHLDPWTWLERLVREKNVAFTYVNCVEKVKACRNVFTNTGKFRLLIRLCLVWKCLHVPLECLKTSGKLNSIYRENSTIGDEILCEILLSVLRQCGKTPFKLNTSISSFLDISWIIPEVVAVEFVPCDTLGMTVSFAGDKAVIMSIKPNSVAAENGKIEVGDVLDTLNNVFICSATKGRLSSILKSNRGRPVSLTAIKAVYTDTRQVYVPIVAVLKQVQFDADILKNRIQKGDVILERSTERNTKKSSSSGYKVTYMGHVDVGGKGDVKQIDKAVNILLAPTISLTCEDGVKFERFKKSVFFELEELGIKCIDGGSSEVLLKHSFMEISSCGSVLSLPNYFAYVAGDKYCNAADHFTCYIFFAKTPDTAYTVLQSIGQGFHRTHFAV